MVPIVPASNLRLGPWTYLLNPKRRPHLHWRHIVLGEGQNVRRSNSQTQRSTTKNTRCGFRIRIRQVRNGRPYKKQGQTAVSGPPSGDITVKSKETNKYFGIALDRELRLKEQLASALKDQRGLQVPGPP